MNKRSFIIAALLCILVLPARFGKAETLIRVTPPAPVACPSDTGRTHDGSGRDFAEEDSSETAGAQSFVVEGNGTTESSDTTEEYSGVMPFASPTPQPNAKVNRFSQLTGTGLGFSFNYPTDWTNLPGRSTVCYIQPIDEGTIYPARVAIALKTLSHKCGPQTAQEELINFLKIIRTQYDNKTFSVETKLDLDTRFMGNKAFSTTYLAYDGKQEIKGYVILTYFDRYVYVYHFLCAYDDYPAFMPAMTYMRDSVTVIQEQAR